MSADSDGYLYPRRVNGARDSQHTVGKPHPDVSTDEEHREGLLRTAWLSEAAAWRLEEGRTIMGTVSGGPSVEPSDRAETGREGPQAGEVRGGVHHPGDHGADLGAPGVLRRVGR